MKHLAAGKSLNLTLSSGVKITLVGPALYSDSGNNQFQLNKGFLKGSVPKRAHGFTVYTPDGSIRDLGTIFTCFVKDSTRVSVIKGSVEVLLKNGSRRLLSEEKAARLSRFKSTITNFPYNKTAILQYLRPRIHSFSSEEASERAVKAIDGDPSSIWHSRWREKETLHPHHIAIDYQLAQKIRGFSYLARPESHKSGTIVKYEFYGSLDGENWFLITKGELPKRRDNTPHEILFKSREVRYVKLVSLSSLDFNHDENKVISGVSAAEIDIIR